VYTQELKDFCFDTKDKSTNTLHQNKRMMSLLLSETSFLNHHNPTLRVRRDFVVKNSKSIPSCSFCGNETVMTTRNDKFKKYCSLDCERKAKTKTCDKIFDKEWLIYQRTELKKSKDDLSRELNVSYKTIDEALSNFDINDNICLVDKRIRTILTNKKRLARFYNKFSTHEIADLFGVSVGTVIKHLKKHEIEIKPPNYWHKSFKKRSKGEKELFDFVNSLTKAKHSDRTVLNGKELDVYVPSLGVAFEFNGIYYHSERFIDKNSHYEKTKQCQEKGVTLYHIWEDDWTNKQAIWKSRIRSILGKTERKIYARDCRVKDISSKEKNDFLERTHLQGRDFAKHKLGLFHNDKLVAVMTFSKDRSNKNDHVLSRFSCELNATVVGGFSKLLAHFKRNNEGNIVTYADLSYTDGNVYIKNGFVESKLYKSNYWYVIDSKRAHKSNFSKSAMKKRFPNFDFKSNTETEMAHELGYFRLFGAGMKTFSLNNHHARLSEI